MCRIPESCALPYEDGLSSGCSDIGLFIALFEEDLSLQNADPLVVSEGEEGLCCSLLGPKYNDKLYQTPVETLQINHFILLDMCDGDAVVAGGDVAGQLVDGESGRVDHAAGRSHDRYARHLANQ